MLAIFCTCLVCAGINRTQSRSPELRLVLMACVLERVLSISNHRAVEIFELVPALQGMLSQLVKFDCSERSPVVQGGTGSGPGVLKS